MNILVTGGAGYIGSITCVQLISAGFRPVILDSLVNAKASVLDRIEQVSGQRPVFIEADVRDRACVVQVLRERSKFAELETMLQATAFGRDGARVQRFERGLEDFRRAAAARYRRIDQAAWRVLERGAHRRAARARLRDRLRACLGHRHRPHGFARAGAGGACRTAGSAQGGHAAP